MVSYSEFLGHSDLALFFMSYIIKNIARAGDAAQLLGALPPLSEDLLQFPISIDFLTHRGL